MRRAGLVALCASALAAVASAQVPSTLSPRLAALAARSDTTVLVWVLARPRADLAEVFRAKGRHQAITDWTRQKGRETRCHCRVDARPLGESSLRRVILPRMGNPEVEEHECVQNGRVCRHGGQLPCWRATPRRDLCGREVRQGSDQPPAELSVPVRAADRTTAASPAPA